MEKPLDKKRSIGEAAIEVGTQTHSIRFWESKFPQIKPEIGKGGRRYYFDKEIAILNKIKSLLYDEGYTISGLQKLLKTRKKSDLKEQNIDFLLGENSSIDKPKNDSLPNNNFLIDDFINPEINLSNNLDKDSINQIILRIENNLKKLENL